MMILQKIIRKIIYVSGLGRYLELTWSQEGEDRVLWRIFEGQKTGFYVDIGAHHPKRFSNTYLFYRKGWRGINVDAMPGCMKLFDKYRPRDINLEMGISLEEAQLDYYIFNEPALNGFSDELSLARNLDANNNYHIRDVKKIKTIPLSMLLLKYEEAQAIDFMSVDVEGFDLQVLKSNDWSRFRPKFVLAELLNRSFKDIDSDPIVIFMKEVGYIIYAKTVNTAFFKDENILS